MNKILTISIHTQKNERPYSLTLPYGVPYEEVYEVLRDIEADLRNFEKEINEQKAKETAEAQTASPDSQVIDAEVVKE